MKMKLSDFLSGLQSAATAEELEAAIHAGFKYPFHGRTWNRICKVRIDRGLEIVAAHPQGRFVPAFGPKRELSVCGEKYKVGRGYNSTGVRYVWHSAKEFAIDVLKRNGLSQRASYRIWDDAFDYPHRCLAKIASALAGNFPDPEMNVLIPHPDPTGHPIRYTIEQNETDVLDKRASQPCPSCLTGTLFDWGCGFSDGFTFINWHCNGCPQVYTEYVTAERMREIRRPR